jgi:hypothetical protein
MRFQIAEGISLLGSMSELSLLFSLTPDRRETLSQHTQHTATALPQLLSALPHLYVCVASLLPTLLTPLHCRNVQSVATGGCRPNKWRQPQNTPPVVLNDVTVPRNCKHFHRSVNVKSDTCSFIDMTLHALCSTGCPVPLQACQYWKLGKSSAYKNIFNYYSTIFRTFAWLSLKYIFVKTPPWRWLQKVTEKCRKFTAFIMHNIVYFHLHLCISVRSWNV